MSIEVDSGELGVFVVGFGCSNPLSLRKDNDTFFLMLPVDEPHFLEFTAVMTDIDDISFEFL